MIVPRKKKWSCSSLWCIVFHLDPRPSAGCCWCSIWTQGCLTGWQRETPSGQKQTQEQIVSLYFNKPWNDELLVITLDSLLTGSGCCSFHTHLYNVLSVLSSILEHSAAVLQVFFIQTECLGINLLETWISKLRLLQIHQEVGVDWPTLDQTHTAE